MDVWLFDVCDVTNARYSHYESVFKETDLFSFGIDKKY